MGIYADFTNFRRLYNTQAPQHAAGDYALSGGFGASATVSAVTANSNDHRFRITITSAGAGQAANPTCTLTFKESWGVAPFAVVCRSGGDQATIPVSCTTTTTALVITFHGTPVAAETYSITGVLLG
jgi:hypothetical protein